MDRAISFVIFIICGPIVLSTLFCWVVIYPLASLKNVKHRVIKFILIPPIAFITGAGLGVLVCFATYDGCFSSWDQFTTTPPEKATKIVAADPSGLWVETTSKQIFHNVWDGNTLTTVWELSSTPTQTSTTEIGGYTDHKPACTLMLGIVDKKAICNNPCGEASLIDSYALRFNGNIYYRSDYVGSGLGLLGIVIFGPIVGIIIFGIPLVVIFSFSDIIDSINNRLQKRKQKNKKIIGENDPPSNNSDEI